VTTIDTCKVLAGLIAVANSVTIPAASCLFFIRLAAVYLRDTYIMAFFGSCWLVVLGCFVFDGTKSLLRLPDVSQPTQCVVVNHRDAWGYIATALYDTLMYISISWRLASFSTFHSWQERLESFVTGDGLGWLFKVILRSGQVYYL
jgi:hypothetical protein